MKAVSLRRNAFFKQVGCADASIFEENEVLINIIGRMLIDKKTEHTVYAIRPETHEFLDFIDGRGFKVTRITLNSYIIKVL